MSNKISIFHCVQEKQRDGSWVVTRNLSRSANVTAMGLSSIRRDRAEHLNWVSTFFGPNMISPKHYVEIEVNGIVLNDIDSMFIFSQLDKGEKWQHRVEYLKRYFLVS